MESNQSPKQGCHAPAAYGAMGRERARCCYYCYAPGHLSDSCPKRMRDIRKAIIVMTGSLCTNRIRTTGSDRIKTTDGSWTDLTPSISHVDIVSMFTRLLSSWSDLFHTIDFTCTYTLAPSTSHVDIVSTFTRLLPSWSDLFSTVDFTHQSFAILCFYFAVIFF